MIQSNIEKIAVLVKQKEEVLPDLENAAGEALARYEAVKKQREQHARLTEIKDLIVWAKVAEKERVRWLAQPPRLLDDAAADRDLTALDRSAARASCACSAGRREET